MPRKKISERACYRCNKIFNRKSTYDYHINHLAKNEKCKLFIIKEEEIRADERKKIKNELKQEFEEKLDDLKKEIIKQTINNTTNNTINNNNIQYVINNYPNALNIEDCLNIDNISKEVYDECKKMYFLDGIKHILINTCDIGVENRPIHCTDSSRLNYLIKTKNLWHIDSKASTICNHLIPVAQTTYAEIYKNKIEEVKNDVDRYMIIANDMRNDMSDKQIQKKCINVIKKNSTNFILKNDKIKELLTELDKKCN